jgi:hydroxymethylbilane synthase
MPEQTPLRLGTRASTLARWQAQWVADRLAAAGHTVELVPITTQGDAAKRESIGSLGSSGVFTKELQRALLDRRIDLAVHSLKDLPTDVVDGLAIAAVPEREGVADALISRGNLPLAALPPGAVIGTGSLRRRAQLLQVRPDLAMRDIRGNVDSRLRKLQDGEFDAIVLATAGLKRLGLLGAVTETIAVEIMLPAVGQGALGIETRVDDVTTRAALSTIDHVETHQSVLAERAMLAALLGGCLAPVAGWCRPNAGQSLALTAAVFSHDGRQKLLAERTGPQDSAELLGQRVAEELLAAGASALIAAARGA